MNREIKFRCWDTVEKEMIRWNRVSCWLMSWLGGRKDKRTDYHFMQYTGLKDNSGIEVYEGDIIENYNYDDQAHCEHYLGRSLIQYYIGLPGFGGFIGEHCYIIGNMYENPDLLSKEVYDRLNNL